MQSRELKRQIQALEFLLKKVERSFIDDIELQSHWAKYVCILSAGFLENSIYEVFRDFVINSSSGPVANYATSTLSKIQNPKTEKFIEVTRAFNSVWADKLEKFVNESGRKEAINSIITNRHKIAHGKNSDITLARVKEYLMKSIQVIEFLEEQVS